MYFVLAAMELAGLFMGRIAFENSVSRGLEALLLSSGSSDSSTGSNIDIDASIRMSQALRGSTGS